jgi:UDP-MurNAc hydroxylase
VIVEWYTNACVRIVSDSGQSVLCDPWVNPGAFMGSWFQWPPLPDEFKERMLSIPCDAIYVTHLHPDHYDPKFISEFSRRRPEVPIYIAKFAHNWLKKSLTNVVSKNTEVIELDPNVEHHIGEGFSIRVFAADHCNPSICGVNVPCQSEATLRGIDSVGILKADGQTIVNANDAMSVKLIPLIAKNIGKADLIMGHFGGGGPYPQCFPDTENKRDKALRIVEQACEMLVDAAKLIDADYVMPFAGQYMLGGSLAGLNEFRSTIPLDDAVSLLKNKTSKAVVSVQPGGFFNLSTGIKSPDYVEPSLEVRNLYLSEISKAKFIYETRANQTWGSAREDLLQAAGAVLKKSRSLSFSSPVSLIVGSPSYSVTINIDVKAENSNIEFGSAPTYSNVIEVRMPDSLLRLLSLRKTNYKGFSKVHWNQADVGSHLTWRRTGAYDASPHMALQFFGT